MNGKHLNICISLSINHYICIHIPHQASSLLKGQNQSVPFYSIRYIVLDPLLELCWRCLKWGSVSRCLDMMRLWYWYSQVVLMIPRVPAISPICYEQNTRQTITDTSQSDLNNNTPNIAPSSRSTLTVWKIPLWQCFAIFPFSAEE